MNPKEKKRILEEFFAYASKEEQQQLMAILKQKKEQAPDISLGQGLGKSISRMAQSMAGAMQKQVGLSERMVADTAKNLIVKLAREYDPSLNGKQIEDVLELFMPGSSPRKGLPVDLLLSMVSHFVDYSLQRMPTEQIEQLPSDWLKTYWQAFPKSIRQVIANFLHGKLSETEFWQKIRSLLR